MTLAQHREMVQERRRRVAEAARPQKRDSNVLGQLKRESFPATA